MQTRSPKGPQVERPRGLEDHCTGKRHRARHRQKRRAQDPPIRGCSVRTLLSAFLRALLGAGRPALSSTALPPDFSNHSAVQRHSDHAVHGGPTGPPAEGFECPFLGWEDAHLRAITAFPHVLVAAVLPALPRFCCPAPSPTYRVAFSVVISSAAHLVVPSCSSWLAAGCCCDTDCLWDYLRACHTAISMPTPCLSHSADISVLFPWCVPLAPSVVLHSYLTIFLPRIVSLLSATPCLSSPFSVLRPSCPLLSPHTPSPL